MAQGHPYEVPPPGPSAVITREVSVPENLSFGEETFMPPRLLAGLLPHVLLDKYIFCQDEKDHLRGYPKEPNKCRDIIFVNLGIGGHVSIHGGRFEQVRKGDSVLAPARAVVLRLQRSRLERQRKATQDVLALLETFAKDNALLSQPFESCVAAHRLRDSQYSSCGLYAANNTMHERPARGRSFAVCGGVVRLLTTLGKHAFGAGTDDTVARSLATIKELLPLVNLVPFKRRRRRHRLSNIILPALLDALFALVEEGQSTGCASAAAPSAAATSAAPTAEAIDFDDEELVLLDLLHAPPESYLASLATVMARVEHLSHVLAWARYDDTAQLGKADALTQSDLHIVSLPRLKLTFQAREVKGSVRLFSVDHADLFITNERNETSAMLCALARARSCGHATTGAHTRPCPVTCVCDRSEGIPHSLLLSNSNDELSVLVPAWPPCRPAIDSLPFSTELVLDRANVNWYKQLEHPCMCS
jgi:hypothetical protein